MPASTGRRFASALIDGGVFVALLVVGALLFGDSSDPRALAYSAAVASSVQLLPEVLLGRTVGKLLVGTRVVDCHGNKPSAGTLLDRAMRKNRVFINGYSLLRELRARHDRLSGTFVVRTNRP